MRRREAKAEGRPVATYGSSEHRAAIAQGRRGKGRSTQRHDSPSWDRWIGVPAKERRRYFARIGAMPEAYWLDIGECEECGETFDAVRVKTDYNRKRFCGPACYQANRRCRGAEPPPDAHGKRSTYVNYVCRCGPCSDANAAYFAARRLAK